jgi:drug/metabolite transporter (DMT)-like permease
MVYVGLWRRQTDIPSRRILAFSVVGGVTAMLGSVALFQGLDRLAPVHMASLGFPVSTGASIVFFSAYSVLLLREPFTRRHAIGMITGILGICGLGLSG